MSLNNCPFLEIIISSTSGPITQFLEQDPFATIESTIENNVLITVGGSSLDWISNIESSWSSISGPNTFTYYNGFKIIESDTMVQLVYNGDIVINADIDVAGKTLVIMSWNGSVTINPGVSLTGETISIFSKKGNFTNNGTLTAPAPPSF